MFFVLFFLMNTAAVSAIDPETCLYEGTPVCTDPLGCLPPAVTEWDMTRARQLLQIEAAFHAMQKLYDVPEIAMSIAKEEDRCRSDSMSKALDEAREAFDRSTSNLHEVIRHEAEQLQRINEATTESLAKQELAKRTAGPEEPADVESGYRHRVNQVKGLIDTINESVAHATARVDAWVLSLYTAVSTRVVGPEQSDG